LSIVNCEGAITHGTGSNRIGPGFNRQSTIGNLQLRQLTMTMQVAANTKEPR